MDRMTTYTFSVGEPKDLRERNLEKLTSYDRLDELDRASIDQGSILLPRFIGVYQNESFVAHGEEESRFLEEGRIGIEFVREGLENANQRLLGYKLGEKDNIHPELIHILYGPCWNTDLVRSCLDDGLGRIGVSDQNHSPDFYAKETNVVADMVSESPFFEGVEEDIDRYVQELTNQLRDYGLTRTEFSLLQILKKQDKKLITSPELLKAFRPIVDILQRD